MWLTYDEDLEVEIKQAHEEGRDVPWLEDEARAVLAMDEYAHGREALAGALLDRVQKAPLKAGYPYEEPDALADIQAARPKPWRNETRAYDREAMRDRVLGAWLGRCAGCLLGKPVECMKRSEVYPMLHGTDNYPLNRYMSADPRYGLSADRAWIDKVTEMPEDDDTNYTIVSLGLLEHFGRDFTPANVRYAWMGALPILHVCTAERVAYRNFTAGMMPPESAMYRNPYREWIGAQIRTDFYGYINPGNPQLAAEYAWRDACVSHTKNGIYGAMFVAAMLSEAALCADAEAIIRTGLSQIPEKSRLSEAVRDVLTWRGQKVSWEAALERIHNRYDENDKHDWCHTVPNALIVCLGLLYGDMDFERSVGLAVTAMFDTDCNGATVGSILGMALGAAKLPDKWTAPLNNRLSSGVYGFASMEISALAERTMKFIS